VKASTIRWTELNNNLGLTQFYGAAMSPSGRVIGGTQDNGSLLFTGNTEGWSRRIGADGCYCAADPTNANIMYAQIYRIRIYRSLNGGFSWRQIGNSFNIRDKGSNFIPYLTLDPNNASRMYFAGAGVWRSDNVTGSATWQQVKGRCGRAVIIAQLRPFPSGWIIAYRTSSVVSLYRTTC
ncbi:MAG: hypothetical protein IH969_03420, partial [Candidatus Krumholzibacteriota bacterium]|nr:hypothetical protein [Candidatus Krumholzibacteriota bacterium]